MFEKQTKEYKLLSKLNTPQKVQTFLESIPFNFEKDGVTCFSAQRALQENKAHCIEGAFIACAALLIQGREATIVSLKVKKPDDDHIIVLFKENGYYGALSKTNHPVLRYRDPVYKTVRELVMTYFHEYFLYTSGKKTLIGYTKPINLKKKYATDWITNIEDVWDVGNAIYNTPVIPIVPDANKKQLRNATSFERTALDVQEWK
jgi:hypothetical protein